MGASLSQSLLSDSNLNVIKKWLDSERKFLVFVGNPGIGKTYHCAAVYNWIVQHKKNKDDFIRYYSEANFLNKMRSSINEFSGSYVEHMQQLADDKWILMDDVGSTGINKWREEVFFEFLDFRYDLDLPTMITSNLEDHDFLSQMHPRVHSRLFSRENFIINSQDCIDFRRNGIDGT